MSRDMRYDAMRVTAIVLVVLQHAWSVPHLDTPDHGWLCYVYGALVSCGVPLFILVSGALNLRPGVSDYGLFFKKRLLRVLVPFVLWAAVIYVLTALSGGYEQVHGWRDGLRLFVPYLAENKINASHWFIHVLLMLYLLTPVLQRALSAGDARKTSGYMLAVVVVLAVLAKVYPAMYLLQYTSDLLIFVGLYVAGFYLSQFCVRQRMNISVGIIGFAVLLAVNVWLHRPAYILVAMCASGLFMALLGTDCSGWSRVRTAVITRVSRYSYFIYLMHIPPMRLFYLWQAGYMPYDGVWIDWLLPVGATVCVLLLSAGAAWCVEKVLGRHALYLGIAPER